MNPHLTLADWLVLLAMGIMYALILWLAFRDYDKERK